MKRRILEIAVGAFVFATFSVTGAVHWVFQFAVLCFAYPAVAWLFSIIRLNTNNHLIVQPFFFAYSLLTLYDYIYDKEMFNPLTVPICLSSIISFVVWKFTHRQSFRSKLIVIPILFLFFWLAQDTFQIIYKIHSSKRAAPQILAQNQNKTYYWSTNCGSCILSMPRLKKHVLKGKVHPICLVDGSTDSLLALKIAHENHFKSKIIHQNQANNEIRYFPTWILRTSHGYCVVSLWESVTFGYDYSFWLWDLFYGNKSDA
jgi:hypothetical protein